MSVHQCVSYEDMHDTIVNMEREMMEKNEYYNEHRGSKWKGHQWENHHSLDQYKKPQGNYHRNNKNKHRGST